MWAFPCAYAHLASSKYVCQDACVGRKWEFESEGAEIEENEKEEESCLAMFHTAMHMWTTRSW